MKIGKRIAAQRMRMDMTCVQLAQKLDVPTNLVMEWESDQSYPEPEKLEQLTVLLGITVEALTAPEEPKRTQESGWSRSWRKTALCASLFLLILGGAIFYIVLADKDVSIWSVLWPTAVLVVALRWLLSQFRIFRLGLTVLGGYYLLRNIQLIQESLDGRLILAGLLVLLGAGFLLDVFCVPNKKS